MHVPAGHRCPSSSSCVSRRICFCNYLLSSYRIYPSSPLSSTSLEINYLYLQSYLKSPDEYSLGWVPLWSDFWQLEFRPFRYLLAFSCNYLPLHVFVFWTTRWITLCSDLSPISLSCRPVKKRPWSSALSFSVTIKCVNISHLTRIFVTIYLLQHLKEGIIRRSKMGRPLGQKLQKLEEQRAISKKSSVSVLLHWQKLLFYISIDLFWICAKLLLVCHQWNCAKYTSQTSLWSRMLKIPMVRSVGYTSRTGAAIASASLQNLQAPFKLAGISRMIKLRADSLQVPWTDVEDSKHCPHCSKYRFVHGFSCTMRPSIFNKGEQ